MKKHKVIVGISGGVDSAVSAYLLMQQGYEVEGLFMKNWDKDDYSEQCTHKQDYQDAMQVCLTLGIKLHYANFSKHYWEQVFEPFLAAVQQGKTPNPDVACNRMVKFDVFLQHALSLGADYIATGHYARRLSPTATGLYISKDVDKDQTYFLTGVPQNALMRTLFPLGEHTKTHVREYAHSLQLSVAAKKDSTGICFIGERQMRDFIVSYVKCASGDIVDEQGHIIGQHQGACLYTLGQRSGMGIGGIKGKQGAWYVAKKELSTNRITVVQNLQHPLLTSHGVRCCECNFFVDEQALATLCKQPLTIRLRHRGALIACRAHYQKNQLHVWFDSPQFAVAPGQYAVLYLQDKCIGGGEIQQLYNQAQQLPMPNVAR